MVEIKVRTEEEFKIKLQEMAKKDKRSLNKFIEWVLEQHIKNEKEKEIHN